MLVLVSAVLNIRRIIASAVPFPLGLTEAWLVAGGFECFCGVFVHFCGQGGQRTTPVGRCARRRKPTPSQGNRQCRRGAVPAPLRLPRKGVFPPPAAGRAQCSAPARASAHLQGRSDFTLSALCRVGYASRCCKAILSWTWQQWLSRSSSLEGP